jgi:hypothetical protein
MGKVLFAADKLGNLRQVDPHLTALSNGYRAPKLMGITDLYPIVRSPKEAGKYTNWSPDPYIPIDKLQVGMGAKRLRIDVNNSSGAFATAQFEVEVAILDRELREIVEADRETYVEKKSLRGEYADRGRRAAALHRRQGSRPGDVQTLAAAAAPAQQRRSRELLRDRQDVDRQLAEADFRRFQGSPDHRRGEAAC